MHLILILLVSTAFGPILFHAARELFFPAAIVFGIGYVLLLAHGG